MYMLYHNYEQEVRVRTLRLCGDKVDSKPELVISLEKAMEIKDPRDYDNNYNGRMS
jgi:hypothetical protein